MNRNKERHKNNTLPIEQRSDKVCINLIKELFANEICLIGDVLHNIIDYSTINVHLNEGLILTFNDIDDIVVKNLKSEFEKNNILHHYNKKEKQLVIYK